MTPAEAAQILGIAPDAPRDEVRRAYRTQIGRHHPDRAGADGADRATAINEAYRILRRGPRAATSEPPGDRPRPQADPRSPHAPWAATDPRLAGAPPVLRIDADTLSLAAPADETFRWLLDAAHDLGEITYLDRSMPIVEVLCRFEGEPASSLVLNLQGRADGTEVQCSVESIEARPGPPTGAVVDVLELALHRRRSTAT